MSIERILVENTSATATDAQEIIEYFINHLSDVDFIDVNVDLEDLLEFAENWLLSPNDKVSDWMVHFYTYHFDICYRKARCLLLDTFQQNRGLFPDEATSFLYRRDMERRIREGEFSFLSQPCDCEECLSVL